MSTARLSPALNLVDPRRLAAVAAVALAAVVTALTVSPAGQVAIPAPRAAASPVPGQPASPAPSAREKAKARASYAKLPLTFVPNHGQAGRGVSYSGSGGGMDLAFRRGGVSLGFAGARGGRSPATVSAPDLRSSSAGTVAGLASAQRSQLDLRFVGANPHPGISGTDRAPGRVSYMVGSRANWQRDLPTYSQVSYAGLWQGVDMRFLGKSGTLKYEFSVAPGADPSNIALDYAGASGLSVAPNGGLRVATARGTLNDSAPVAYQVVGGRRVPVEASYRLGAGNRYGFTLGTYDRTKPLVIDPGVDYGTYLGGNDSDEAYGVATDSSGNTYVTGFTSASGFPTTVGAFQTTGGGSSEGFVTKLSADGSTALYSTYLGGNSLDYPTGIAVDSSGAAYVLGYTESTNFPTAGVGVDTSYNGGGDMFVTKVAPSGSSLSWSTYLGGSGGDGYQQNGGIALDSAGNAWVDSVTQSTDFPGTSGSAQPANGGGFSDGVLARLNTSGVQSYGTYIGGSGADRAIDVAVGPGNAVYVSGSTTGSFPTTAGAYDTTFNDAGSNEDAFVAKYTSAGARTYATYVGSDSSDIGQRIAVDGSGNAYVAGTTYGSDFPTSVGAYQTTNPASVSGFVTKLNAAGSGLVYSTLLGGTTGPTFLSGLAVDSSGQAYVAGNTSSATFPTTAGASQTTLKNGGADAYMTKFNAAGTGLAYSTYFGGTDGDRADDLALSPTNTARIVGFTYSAQQTSGNPDGFPVTDGAFDTTRAGGSSSSQSYDGFMVDVDPGGALTPQCSDGIDNDGDGKTDYPADPGCTSAADNTESPNPTAPVKPKPRPATPKPAPAPVTCKRRSLSLVRAYRSGRKVVLKGLVARRLAGQKVTILANYGGRRKAGALRQIATLTPGSDGQFTVKVGRPSKRLTQRARYVARVGSASSASLKLYQQLRTTSVKQSGTRITVRGTIQRSLLGRRYKVVVKRLYCGHYTKVGEARPSKRGRYSVSFSAGSSGQVSLYRAEVRLRRSPHSRSYVKRYARAQGIRLTDETG